VDAAGKNAELIEGADRTALSVKRIVRQYPDCYTHISIPLKALDITPGRQMAFHATLSSASGGALRVGSPDNPKPLVLWEGLFGDD